MIDEGCTRAPDLVHGTRRAYQHGCECHAAVQANRDYMRAWARTPAGRACKARERRAPRVTVHPQTARRQRRTALALALHQRGYRPAEIARELCVSTRTVERYLAALP